ncbi:hypothetical protein DERP_015306 [Dermatophagoides pteronyssinus]|uniref:Uncharacterized protein n=1 Tax=Dermatophagoides pteronyssinus TaxID=6956 RepID=A0ABQ8JUJ6_DERPT|nr:hypothetical protein DERP_015306 [Dermatophagoides pteronyssinus]
MEQKRGYPDNDPPPTPTKKLKPNPQPSPSVEQHRQLTMANLEYFLKILVDIIPPPNIDSIPEESTRTTNFTRQDPFIEVCLNALKSILDHHARLLHTANRDLPNGFDLQFTRREQSILRMQRQFGNDPSIYQRLNIHYMYRAINDCFDSIKAILKELTEIVRLMNRFLISNPSQQQQPQDQQQPDRRQPDRRQQSPPPPPPPEQQADHRQ